MLKLCNQVSLQKILEMNLKNARKIYTRFFQRKPLIEMAAFRYQPVPGVESNGGDPCPSVSQLR